MILPLNEIGAGDRLLRRVEGDAARKKFALRASRPDDLYSAASLDTSQAQCGAVVSESWQAQGRQASNDFDHPEFGNFAVNKWFQRDVQIDPGLGAGDEKQSTAGSRRLAQLDQVEVDTPARLRVRQRLEGISSFVHLIACG